MKHVTAAAAVIALAVAAPVVTGTAHAMSVGFYGTAGGGLADWEASDVAGFEDRRDTRHTGAGVVLDTGSPFDPLSYRLAIGWERVVHESAPAAAGFTMQGLVVDQDLTLDLIYGPGPLRMWAGPELRLGLLKGSPDGVPGPDENFVAIGLGPVLGFDFRVNPALAISWKFGYLVTGYVGEDRSSFNHRNDTSLGEGHAYATLAFMFNLWDGGYRGGQPGPAAPQEQYPRRW